MSHTHIYRSISVSILFKASKWCRREEFETQAQYDSHSPEHLAQLSQWQDAGQLIIFLTAFLHSTNVSLS